MTLKPILFASALAAGALTAPLAAHAELVTLNFSGVVTDNGGIDATVGSSFTGTYTFDTATPDTDPSADGGRYANPRVSYAIHFQGGAQGDFWYRGGAAGSAPSDDAITTTGQTGFSVTIADGGAFLPQLGGGAGWEAYEGMMTIGGAGVTSGPSLSAVASADFSKASVATFQLSAHQDLSTWTQLSGTITSLSTQNGPVPEPQTAALLLCGIAVLVGMSHRRPRESAA
jgi:hypothetical protein